MRQHFPDHARTKQSRKNLACSVNLYEFFRPCYCVIAILTGVDGYSGRSIQWARTSRARHNDAFVWAVGRLENRCETGIPAFEACTSGLLWIAAYSECRPNNDHAAVGQYARHGNGDHRATRREGSVADSARNRGPTQSYSLERDDLVFGNPASVPAARSARPRSCCDRRAYFREVETVPARRPGEPPKIEVLGRRPLRGCGRKPATVAPTT